MADIEGLEEVQTFVAERLLSIGLEDEAITQYFAGIVVEDSMLEDERLEAITALLTDVIEESPTDIIQESLAFWNKVKKEKAEEAERKVQKAIEAAKEREQSAFRSEFESASSQREGSSSMSSRHISKDMTKEERKKREALLAKYAYDLDEMVEGEDGETEIQYKDRSGTKNGAGGSKSSDPLLMANTNADIVKQKEAQRRVEMKKANEVEKEKNRLALEKQRQAQEKEKRRTQKQERRRM
ncbi:MAG: hypothetical protein J3Q66DRAFT_438395 [Benniella sp.]|nr:MAG: hypothetical protein J3Q66DRAFT_438395 [Benniella sp.]